MDVSIIIVNWNGKSILRDCLRSIFTTTQQSIFEVIVVDNASTDESSSMVTEDFPIVRLLQNRENLGFAAANNQGFKIARGRYTLLLNSDTVLRDATLDATIAYLDSHPSVGALGCRCEFPDGSFQTSCYRFTNLLELFMIRLLPLGSIFNERLNIGRYWGQQFTAPTDVDVVAGCFLMIRSQILDSVGGLDEDFFMYGEDEEWCSRIKQAGWRIIYFPSASIVHLHRFSSRKAQRTLNKIECLSPVLVLQKRRGLFIAWIANLILLGGVSLRFPVWAVMDLTKGNLKRGMIQNRFKVFSAHIEGFFRPIWIPKPKPKIPETSVD